MSASIRDMMVADGAFLAAHPEALEAAYARIPQDDPDNAANLWALLQWMRGWALWGFPTFRLSHGLCAELLLTDPSSMAHELLAVPFSAYQLELPAPDSPIIIDRGNGGEIEATHINVAHGATHVDGVPAMRFWASPDDGTELDLHGWAPATTIGDLIRPNPSPDITAQDNRSMAAITRLIANFSLYLATLPGDGTPRGSIPGLKVQGSRPETRRFVVGQEVKLDPRIRAQASTRNPAGGIRIPWRTSYRFVVRGHWRNQRVGPERAETRRTWVRPHWRGPETGAELLARRYRAEGPGGKP